MQLSRPLDRIDRRIVALLQEKAKLTFGEIGKDVGLSATAVAAQAPELLDRLRDATAACGWSFGRPFLVHYCRVGVMNDVANCSRPRSWCS